MHRLLSMHPFRNKMARVSTELYEPTAVLIKGPQYVSARQVLLAIAINFANQHSQRPCYSRQSTAELVCRIHSIFQLVGGRSGFVL